MMQEISSAHNPQIKELRALATSKKARQEAGRFLVEGWRALDSLLTFQSKQYAIVKLVVTPEWKGDARLPDGFDILVLSEHLFGKISDVKNTQGIMGVVQHSPAPFNILPDEGNYLLVDGISDPGNMGTLIRSAVGAGFNGVLLYNDCVDVFNPKVVRSTMGTFAFIDIQAVSGGELAVMKDRGYELAVTTGIEGDNIYETKFGSKTILVIGSEAHGVSGELMQRADRKISIPLESECESLNAAIAGSICMFQMTRS